MGSPQELVRGCILRGLPDLLSGDVFGVRNHHGFSLQYPASPDPANSPESNRLYSGRWPKSTSSLYQLWGLWIFMSWFSLLRPIETGGSWQLQNQLQFLLNLWEHLPRSIGFSRCRTRLAKMSSVSLLFEYLDKASVCD